MSGTYTPVQGLILLAYNAYYNRFLKYEALLQDYLDNSEGSDYLIKNVNFNPADGLNTIHIAGNGELDNRLEFIDYSFTYALLIEYNPALTTREEIYADEDTKILSKWFILDNDRTRGGQYRLSLRRDVLVDYMKQIKTSPIFVEKGIITDLENPLLLNNEDRLVNQIKKQEILLKDKTDCPWLVIYLKKGALGNQGIGPDSDGYIPVNTPDNENYYEDINTPIASWQYYQYSSSDYQYVSYIDFRVHFWWNTHNEAEIYKASSLGASSLSYTNTTRGNLSVNNITKQKLDAQYLTTYMNTMKTQAVNAFGYKLSNPLLEYNGKIIKDSDGKFWEVKVYTNGSGTQTDDVTSSSAPALKSTMTDAWRAAAQQPSVNPNDKAFQCRAFYTNYRVEFIERKDITCRINLGAYTGTGTNDSPLFDAIAIPYGKMKFYGSGGLIDVDSTAERSLIVANSLCRILTSEWVLDFQLLPYCPVQTLINPNYEHRISIRYANDSCVFGEDDGDYSDVFLVCPNANFSFDIQKEITIDDNSDVPSVFKRKYINDCTLLRLCSPNYNGLFEMNLAKNNGIIHSFNVDITLRPFNPYIHVNPDFSFLYGSDFNDLRGLVCGGDFSLGIINDAWNVYEIQNKNYQAIFDRQIQNLDINQSIARQEAGWGMAAGVVSGAASGAAGGAIVGGGWGALAGAVIGAGTSAAGGAMDLANLQKRQQEARSYAIDNYNLQLGNVRALPYSITKTSALTFNNKFFPFIEIYECSEEEKEAYYNKLYWNGMTIGIIDRIEKYMSNYYSNYFRGKLIALHGEEGSNAVENRIIEAINYELMKGVFI